MYGSSNNHHNHDETFQGYSYEAKLYTRYSPWIQKQFSEKSFKIVSFIKNQNEVSAVQ